MSSRFAAIAATGVALALAPMASHVRAEPIAKPVAGVGTGATSVRELMPPKGRDAWRCYEARVNDGAVDVEDWGNVHWVQVEGQWRDGQPAKMPVAAVKSREVERILIQIVHDAEAPSESGRYTLWTSISFKGWKKKPLYSVANCRYETSRLLFKNGDFVKDEKGEYVSEPVTPQISCGVEGDGGGASLFYVEGAKPSLKLLFHDGGMRMSGTFSVNNYTVGGEHAPDGQVVPSQSSPGYLMTELPAGACRDIERQAIEAMNAKRSGH